MMTQNLESVNGPAASVADKTIVMRKSAKSLQDNYSGPVIQNCRELPVWCSRVVTQMHKYIHVRIEHCAHRY